MSPTASMSLAALAVMLAAPALVTPAMAVELPSRKAGYWEIRMTMGVLGKGNEIVTHACIDAATDKVMMAAGSALVNSMCTRSIIQQTGDSFAWDSACTIGTKTTQSHIEVSGDFQSTYTMTMTKGQQEGSQPSMMQHAKWLADTCPDGLRPGDIQLPGGMIVNAAKALSGADSKSAVPKP